MGQYNLHGPSSTGRRGDDDGAVSPSSKAISIARRGGRDSSMNARKPLIRLFDGVLRRRSLHSELRRLRAFDALPPADRLAAQERRLRNLLEHAARRVPYYRRLFGEIGLTGEDGIDLARFRDLPELRREHLHDHFDELKSDDLSDRNWQLNSTGGSTGVPVTVVQDAEYFDLTGAVKYRQYEWTGYEIGDSIVKLWGSKREIVEGSINLKAKLGGLLRNITMLNSYRMTPDHMRDYVEHLRGREPVLLESYGQGGYELAKFVNRGGLQLAGIGSIITSATTLYPFMRTEIERAFGAKAYNRYGTREIGDVACERPGMDGLDVSLYTQFVEVLTEDGKPCRPGEDGELVITNLANFAMPMIRYRIDDRAVVGISNETDAGQSVSNLSEVMGRSMDYFVRRDGTVASPFLFVDLLRPAHASSWYRQVQIVQEEFERFAVKLVLNSEPPAGVLEEMESMFHRVMGGECEVAYEFVDEIPVSASGKDRFTISKVR